MIPLSAGERDEICRAVQDTFDQTMSIERPARDPDGMGGQTVTLNQVAAGVPCRLGPPTQAVERETAERLSLVIPAMLTCPIGTDLQSGDQILIGSRCLRVKQVLGPRSYQVSLRVLCTEGD